MVQDERGEDPVAVGRGDADEVAAARHGERAEQRGRGASPSCADAIT